MIDSHDRAGWFGASDTSIIVGNWDTKTFRSWWMQKLGLNTDHYTNTAMNAGTYYEHAILDAIGAPRKDHQILIPELRLRANLDGDGPGKIFEVKTHRADKPFKPSKAYWRQAQVQTYAKLQEEGTLPETVIVAYGLTEAEYRNFFLDIDPSRITRHPIEYDPQFIAEYLERLAILCEALEAGTFPRRKTE